MAEAATVPVLDVKGLQAWYGESHILHGMDFQVRAGEVVTLLGRNGAGKSTTLKSIMGIIGKRRGSIMFDGKETIHLSSDKITVLTRGQILAEGDYATLTQDERVKEAYLGAGHG